MRARFLKGAEQSTENEDCQDSGPMLAFLWASHPRLPRPPTAASPVQGGWDTHAGAQVAEVRSRVWTEATQGGRGTTTPLPLFIKDAFNSVVKLL